MKRFRIYDNQGKTFDRFTIVIREPDTNICQFFGASERPYHPQGFGQYVGESPEYTGGAHLGKKVKSLDGFDPMLKNYLGWCVKVCGWDLEEKEIKLT